MISNRPANLRCLRIAAVLAVAIGVRAGAQSPSDSLCIFSGPERSTIAWESAARSSSGGSVIGHVVLLHNLQPVPSARVTLEPGAFLTMTDRAGRFQLGGAPNGRYLIRVRALGRGTVADSVTLGADGLVVLAALAQPAGDIGITCPTRSAPSRRPPSAR